MNAGESFPPGCCGYDPRPNAVPPNTSPDDHKVNAIWYLGFGVGYFGCGCYAFFGQYGNFLFYPLVFMTALCVYQCIYKRYKRKNRHDHRVRLPDIFRAFAQSFFSAGLMALIAESIVTLVITLIFYVNVPNFKDTMGADSDDSTPGDKSSFSSHFYYFLQAFFVAGLIEEYCKGFLLQYTMKLYLSHRKYLNNLDIKSIIWLGLAVGLGFGTMEGVLYVCIYGGNKSILSQLILWLVRVFVAIPFHTIMGIMWGFELAKRDGLKWNTINLNSNNTNSNENMINNNNNNNNNNNSNSHTGFKAWFYLGIKQVLWHGGYDFIEMEFSLVTASDNYGEEIEFAIIGCVIALVITMCAGFVSWRTYKRLVAMSTRELIPDDVEDADDQL